MKLSQAARNQDPMNNVKIKDFVLAQPNVDYYVLGLQKIVLQITDPAVPLKHASTALKVMLV